MKMGWPRRTRPDLTYFSRLADAETFTRQAYVEAYRRGTETANVVCAVQDGAEWQQGLVDVLRPDAVRILDFPTRGRAPDRGGCSQCRQRHARVESWLDEQAHTLKHAADGAARCWRRWPTCRSSAPLIRTRLQKRAIEPWRTSPNAWRRCSTPRSKRRVSRSAAAVPKAPTRSWSRRDSKAAACTGHELTWIRWWRCGPSRAPIAGRRPGRGSLRGCEPTLTTVAAHAGEARHPIKHAADARRRRTHPSAAPHRLPRQPLSPPRGKSIVNGRPSALHP